MKHFILAIIMLVVGVFLGTNFGPEFIQADINQKSEPEEKKPLYWVAPMDKNYRRDQPGLSPMGMELVPVYEESSSADDNAVLISPAVENNLGVKVAKTRREVLMMPIDTIGTVQFDESRITHIHPRVEGWIEKLYIAATGDSVKKGQVLFELYSPELVNAQREYLSALRSKNRSLIKAARNKMKALGLKEEHINAVNKKREVGQLVKFTAEQDGVIIDLKVREGMHIDPMTEVMSIGALDSVWIRGEVFERQAYLIQRGQSVDISLNSVPDRSWNGTINYIYPSLNPDTRTLQFRTRVHNPDLALRPNMLTKLSVQSLAQEAHLTVPRTAVIKAGSHNRVVKSLGEGRYQSVAVEVGMEGVSQVMKGDLEIDEPRIQIRNGLSEQDHVVVSSQFLIDSESNVEAELMRMEDSQNAKSQEASGNTVVTNATIHKVMSSMGMINVTHEAIPEWDWPVMTMDFPVSGELDLSELNQDDKVRLEIEKKGDWDFLVIRVLNGNEANNHSMHEEMKAMQNGGDL